MERPSFFTTYAETDDIEIQDLNLKIHLDALSELDRFILSEIEILKRSVTESMDSYAIHEALQLLPKFLDSLTNWYVRRSRQRVWVADKRAPDKMAFYSTCYYVLTELVKLLAPFCPFVTEVVWERLGNKQSVHLADWPEINTSFIDIELSNRVNLARQIVSIGLAIRAKEKIRTRQPLMKAMIGLGSGERLDSQIDTLREELNVKEVEFLIDESKIADRVGKANARLLGPKFGKNAQKIIEAVKAGDFSLRSDGSIDVAGFVVDKDMVEVRYQGKEGLPVEALGDLIVSLDINLTPELELEGLSRDLVRQIQELRKEADLNVADRIILAVVGAKEVVLAHGEFIKHETLSQELYQETMTLPQATKEIVVGDKTVHIQLRVA